MKAHAALLLCAMLAGGMAQAADAATCRTVRMADPGWADIAATNALAGIVLDALGYQQKVLPLSVPITYAGMRKGQVDVFLGNWMPAQRALVQPLLDQRTVEQVHANLPAARFTLAVPEYVARAGVKTFGDLATHADRFGKRIYGIESGAPANQTIRKMIGAGKFDLANWTLVESSEQGMLSQVARVTRGERWIVFLAWEPHQMNNRFRLTYLEGGGAEFGPASVHTVTRRGYRAACPNVARLFSQLEFSAPLEHAIIADVTAKKDTAAGAARRQLQARPELLERWLGGVTTFDGTAAMAAVLASLAANQHPPQKE